MSAFTKSLFTLTSWADISSFTKSLFTETSCALISAFTKSLFTLTSCALISAFTKSLLKLASPPHKSLTIKTFSNEASSIEIFFVETVNPSSLTKSKLCL